MESRKSTASPGHKLGQIVGTIVEAHLGPRLERVVAELGAGYYLDRKGDRPARQGKKITWVDANGTRHDLDYVIERDGTPNRLGRPVAFVEVAWRRYTKHSRNKSKELAGAVVPLKQQYPDSCRFIGAVVAGEWTEGGLDEMRKQGVVVAYLDYSIIQKAFLEEGGVNLDYEEEATEAEKRAVLAKLATLTPQQISAIGGRIFAEEGEDVAEFLAALKASVLSEVTEIVVTTTFASTARFGTAAEAVAHLQSMKLEKEEATFSQFFIQIIWANGDRAETRCAEREKAIRFLLNTLGG